MKDKVLKEFGVGLLFLLFAPITFPVFLIWALGRSTIEIIKLERKAK